MPPKRACDVCISRKVKCDGSWPCVTCRDAVKKVSCTYLKPPRKRGPKIRRGRQSSDQVRQLEAEVLGDQLLHDVNGSESPDIRTEELPYAPLPEGPILKRIPKEVLAPIIRLYQQCSYSVWPVVNAEELLRKLGDVDSDNTSHEAENVACLATALCAATMAQLQLAPVPYKTHAVDCTTMAQACLRIRGNCESHREHLDMSSLLVSFFLHVYHAKVNQRTSAMMYIQEAMSGARILRLDESIPMDVDLEPGPNACLIANKDLVFPLLWVSERYVD